MKEKEILSKNAEKEQKNNKKSQKFAIFILLSVLIYLGIIGLGIWLIVINHIVLGIILIVSSITLLPITIMAIISPEKFNKLLEPNKPKRDKRKLFDRLFSGIEKQDDLEFDEMNDIIDE